MGAARSSHPLDHGCHWELDLRRRALYERGTCETQYPAELLLVRLIHSYAQASPLLKPAVVAIGISSDQFFGRVAHLTGNDLGIVHGPYRGASRIRTPPKRGMA